VEARLHNEIDTVLGDRLPTADDVRVRYTEKWSCRGDGGFIPGVGSRSPRMNDYQVDRLHPAGALDHFE